MSVRAGLEVLCEDRASLVRGRRVGLLAHQASVDRHLAHAIERLLGAGARLERLFAPEHGVAGGHQDMIAVHERRDPVSGLPVVSLYGADEASLAPRPADVEGLDLLVADLVDVGARYYTFFATVVRCLPVLAAAGVPLLVLDRPNPLGGVGIEGGPVEPRFASFVGELDVPNRHGLTLGELVLLAARQRGLEAGLEVVPADGWRREQWWDGTGLPWVGPSPNMPTLDTAVVYPGGCLYEGTNLSEGRGTTRPFELVGAPWLDPRRLAHRLARWSLPGCVFRPVAFVPGFQKHAGQVCGGVQVHVTSRHDFRPVLTGLAVVAAARAQDPGSFRWRDEPYEFVSDRLAFDLLAGGTAWREALEAGADPREIAAGWRSHERAFAARRRDLLLYH